MGLSKKEAGELERLRRDLADGRIAATARGNAAVRIAELERKQRPPETLFELMAAVRAHPDFLAGAVWDREELRPPRADGPYGAYADLETGRKVLEEAMVRAGYEAAEVIGWTWDDDDDEEELELADVDPDDGERAAEREERLEPQESEPWEGDDPDYAGPVLPPAIADEPWEPKYDGGPDDPSYHRELR